MVKNTEHVTSDLALINLNTGIEQALLKYLPADWTGTIRFDMPDKENLPSGPTVCVFLYDIQEDLELRHGRPRQYDPLQGTFTHRQVHVRCCYLLTYWEPTTSRPMLADAQPIQVMNMALNGLLNMQLPDHPSAFTRVVAPSEHLSSLGNFWQSLGDRPRLCLNFNVTIPIELGLSDAALAAPPVLHTDLKTQGADWERDDLALQYKRELIGRVIDATAKAAASDTDWPALRTQLARLQVTCDYVGDDGNVLPLPRVCVAGLLDETTCVCVDAMIADMSGGWSGKADIITDTLEVVLLPAATPRGEEGGI